MASKYTILYFFILAAVINVPFIIPNIYFTTTEICLTHWLGPGINMEYWLKIQQANQCGFILGLLITAIHRIISQETKECLIIFAVAFIILNTLFEISWIILGSYMFWSFPTNSCTTYFNIFMFCQLIIFYLTTIFFLILCRKYFMESQFKEEEDELERIGGRSK